MEPNIFSLDVEPLLHRQALYQTVKLPRTLRSICAVIASLRATTNCGKRPNKLFSRSG